MKLFALGIDFDPHRLNHRRWNQDPGCDPRSYFSFPFILSQFYKIPTINPKSPSISHHLSFLCVLWLQTFLISAFMLRTFILRPCPFYISYSFHSLWSLLWRSPYQRRYWCSLRSFPYLNSSLHWDGKSQDLSLTLCIS